MKDHRLLLGSTYSALSIAVVLAACSSPGTNGAPLQANDPDAASPITGESNEEADAASNDAGKKDATSAADADVDDDGQALLDAGPIPQGARLIASGLAQTCSGLPNGNAKCWGHGWFGNLGNGVTGANSNKAVSVLNVSSVKSLAMGKYFGCAIVAGGKVKCWGDGQHGELGNGTNDLTAVPVEVTGITGATGIATGWYHACAIVAGGAVKCWGGFDTSGALGSSIAAKSNVPVDADYVAPGVVSIAAGAQHTCVVYANGDAYCFGLSPFGAVGVPMSGVAEISGNDSTTCARMVTGKVECWGMNNNGQLGSGAFPVPGGGNQTSFSPVEVVGISNAVSIAVGSMHVCALLSGGTVQCWGGNSWGQLGRGDDDDSATPAPVIGISGAVAIAAGSVHSCAKFSNGTAKCWGENGGTLGNGTNDLKSTVPVSVVDLP